MIEGKIFAKHTSSERALLSIKEACAQIFKELLSIAQVSPFKSDGVKNDLYKRPFQKEK
jgi:hypothetical protein